MPPYHHKKETLNSADCSRAGIHCQDILLVQPYFSGTYTMFPGSLSSSENLHQSSKAKRKRMTTLKSHIHFTGLFQTSWRFKKVSMEPWMLVARGSRGAWA